MTCREVVECLAEYLLGELPRDPQLAFEEHLGTCPRCVAYLQSYEETVKLGKAVLNHPEERVLDEVPEELVRAILADRNKRKR